MYRSDFYYLLNVQAYTYQTHMKFIVQIQYIYSFAIVICSSVVEVYNYNYMFGQTHGSAKRIPMIVGRTSMN